MSLTAKARATQRATHKDQYCARLLEAAAQITIIASEALEQLISHGSDKVVFPAAGQFRNVELYLSIIPPSRPAEIFRKSLNFNLNVLQQVRLGQHLFKSASDNHARGSSSSPPDRPSGVNCNTLNLRARRKTMLVRHALRLHHTKGGFRSESSNPRDLWKTMLGAACFSPRGLHKQWGAGTKRVFDCASEDFASCSNSSLPSMHDEVGSKN